METDELTDEEVRMLEESSIEYPSGIDVSTVDTLVGEANGGVEPVAWGDIRTATTPEERAAKHVLLLRRYREEYQLDDRDINLLLTKRAVETGKVILERNGDYYRFRPCIELLFELDSDQVMDFYRYLSEFEESDFSAALEQHRQRLFDQIRNCAFEDVDARSAVELLKAYENALPIYECGFPNLLALKRILDGETPNNRTLQKKSASSVRRELTDSSNHPNSVYFDLIVEAFDRDLRNGIAHGDIVNDGGRGEIRIPTRNARYSYGELADIVKGNLSNATFLTGMFRAIAEWRYVTCQTDALTRGDLGI